ncbi:hypothetical protein [Chitinophaga agri]|uniref:Outer membrane protein beta-barrel domain-containing protein n=1 Tax=Chitinophaga agri TaxID=2703787 RepID=A0A6B9ZCT1_9BACT|nr:hypothetical protein [Chitinophaga agri]QHS59124.1 hypothetical protein GWR21_05800 [Chitinophaga agri]
MIRTILFTAILMSATTVAVKAQESSAADAVSNASPAFGHPQQLTDTNYLRKKWFVTRYTGLSTGFVGFKGGSGTYLSVPLALQVNRELNNNLYAFGSVSAEPYLFNSNFTFAQPGNGKTNNYMQVRNFGAAATARIGLTYTNNDRTFSISGSIGVSRGTNNGFSPFYAPASFPMMGNMQR